MGLVILSVFALAFVACGDSDSGNNSGTPGTGSVDSGRAPVAISIAQLPLELANGLGYVNEGAPINLTGMILNVTYPDGGDRTVPVSDVRKMSISPAVYLYNERYTSPMGYTYDPYNVVRAGVASDNTQYTVYYTEGGRTVSLTLDSTRDFGGTQIRRLVDIDVTGQMVKQEYLIDDIPNYNGLTVWGVYSRSNANSSTQADYYREVIPLTTAEPEYRWAWVWNRDPGVGSFAPTDDPGVLLSIGSYGRIESTIFGTPGATTTVPSTLYGKRVEITTLHRVDGIKWNPEPSWSRNKVFYDNPMLIGANWTQEAWVTGPLSDGRVDVTYSNGETKNYNLRELQRMNYFEIDSVGNTGWGGNWARLDFFPVTRNLFKVRTDVDTLAYPSTVTGGDTEDFNRDIVAAFGTGVSAQYGWAEWAVLGAANTNLRFVWRGKNMSLNVPVYNRPASLTASVKAGGNSVTMNGYDAVFMPTEGRAVFMSRIKVSVTYTSQGREGNLAEATRDDVYADILAGTCRDVIPFRDGIVGSARTAAGITQPVGNVVSVPLYSGATSNGWRLDPATDSFPTLTTTAIWNWRDRDGDLRDMVAKANQLVGATTGTSTGTEFVYPTTAVAGTVTAGVASTSVLTKAQTALYGTRERYVNARIEYTGFAGNPLVTRTVRNSSDNQIQVAVTGYTENPPGVDIIPPATVSTHNDYANYW